MSSLRIVLAFGLLALLPGKALAQSWTACIDPASGGPTAEGFLAIREAAAKTLPPRGLPALHIARISRTASGAPPPFRIVQIELMRAGASAGGIRWDETSDQSLPVEDQACFRITATQGPFGLWHYWGPYFPLGSAVVSEDQKVDLEYLTVGYEPGNSVFRLEGHADTLGSSEANLRLAARRNDAVARELVRLGVRWDDIEQISVGEAHLARPTADNVAEPLNRRVSIRVVLRRAPATAAR